MDIFANEQLKFLEKENDLWEVILKSNQQLIELNDHHLTES